MPDQRPQHVGGNRAPRRFIPALYLGNLHEVSRKVEAWIRHPDADLLKKLG